MTHILVIHSSATGTVSVSRRLTTALLAKWRAADPTLSIVERDIGANLVPHLTAESLGGTGRGEATGSAAEATRILSDALVTELQAADILVLGAPMYNFGIASTLKAWFDHVLRAGVTFRYTAAGPEGLLTGKRAVIVSTRGGAYSEGPAAAFDMQEPHLRTLLGFVGITDVTIIRAERQAMGPDAATAETDAALAALPSLG